jgi:hypothetical protein
MGEKPMLFNRSKSFVRMTLAVLVIVLGLSPDAALAQKLTLICKWSDGDPDGSQVYEIDFDTRVVSARSMDKGMGVDEFTVAADITASDITFPNGPRYMAGTKVKIDRRTGEQMYFDNFGTGGAFRWRPAGRTCEPLRSKF